VCLNMGLGKGLADNKVFEHAVEDLTQITGQRAVITKAKRAVSNFKLRIGWNVGCRVTLRGKRMYEFLDRLMNVAMPRIRDFRGVKANAFDQQYNYSLGLEDQYTFPEIDPDRSDIPLGMDITIVISGSKKAEESRRLLELMGMPFQKPEDKAATAV
ncbi:MAG: 50S ribosomal protein L5, partial [Planctomycetes bacterium]|nr:50S ribosomal protein L5 [Planctomycetota bacterium]